MANDRRNPKVSKRSHTKMNKAMKRPKRGVNINDIEKLKSRPFKIIDTDVIPVSDKTLMEIPTREDKTIQKHQTTRTLHKKNDISVPECKVIRHGLPNKSLNPCMKSMHREPFKLPNHYIQYQTSPDPGRVSFTDYYDLKKDDIDWLIQQLLIRSVNDNDHDSIVNKQKSTYSNNISGQHLVEIVRKNHRMQTMEYRTKLIQSMKKKQQQNEKDKKEHSVSSNVSLANNNSNHNNNKMNNGCSKMSGHKKRMKTRSNSPRKDQKTCDPFMNNSSFSLRATSLSLDVFNKTPPPDANIFAENMMREHSMSPSNDFMFNGDGASFMQPSQSIPSLFHQLSYPYGDHPDINNENMFNNNSSNNHSNHNKKSKVKNENQHKHHTKHKRENNMNVTIGNTRLTRLSLSKLLYFLEHEMFERAKYKSDPERYFPLKDVIHSVKHWDPSYDVLDIEAVYYHWIERRRNNGAIEEKSLIRKFQEPPDHNDDDSNTAFRPRVSDERHVATRRQTKKPKKNTKESYVRLELLMETIEKQLYFWKKQLEIEQIKRKMALKGIAEREKLLHKSQYIQEKARCIDVMTYPDSKHNALFNTFSSSILHQKRYQSLNFMNDMGIKPLLNKQTLTVLRLNDNLNDIRKYKKKWENICNRIVPTKTDVILDAMEENASHLKTSHIDNVCNKMGIVPLSTQLAQLRNRYRCIHESYDNNVQPSSYHWEINVNHTMDIEDNNDDDDITYSEKEENIVDELSTQRHNTIQQRLLESISSYDTDPKYKWIKKKQIEKKKAPACAPVVAVPSISSNGELQIKVYHGLTQNMDHVEYEPTPMNVDRHNINDSNEMHMFEQLQFPTEAQIARYDPERRVWNEKKRRNYISYEVNHDLHILPPPAPKRQKISSIAAPSLKKTQSLSQVPSSRKKKNNNSNNNNIAQMKQLSMHSLLEQNKHRQQYIELKKLQIQTAKNNESNDSAHVHKKSEKQKQNKAAKGSKGSSKDNSNNLNVSSSKESSTKRKKKDKSKKKKDKSDKNVEKKSKKKAKSNKKSSKKKSSQKNTLAMYTGFIQNSNSSKKRESDKSNKSMKSSKKKSKNSSSSSSLPSLNNRSNNSNNNGNNNNNNNQTQARLPTPDSNPHNQLNPTPPPPVTSRAVNPPLNQMAHIPKFDIKIDPELLSRFKMNMSVPNISSTAPNAPGGGPVAQTMTINSTPPTPPANLQFNAIGRPKKMVSNNKLSVAGNKISSHSRAHSSTITGRPAMANMPPMTAVNIDKRKPPSAANKPYSFADNVVIAMPPNAANSNTNNNPVPSIPQLPQLPATQGTFSVNTPSQTPSNATRRAPVTLAANNNAPPPNNTFASQPPVSVPRQRAHPPFPSSFSANSVPPPPSAMPSNVGLQPQYNPQASMRNRSGAQGGAAMNNNNNNHHHHHHRRAHNQHQAVPQTQQAPPSRQPPQQRVAPHPSQHLPQFGATPSINQQSAASAQQMMAGGGSMNTANAPQNIHNHPATSYRTQHRNNTVVPPAMRTMASNTNIPLSPRQMSEMRHNRINNNNNNNNLHPNNNRNKQINPKEIIELDQ